MSGVFFTAQQKGKQATGDLLRVQLGAAWVYAGDWDTLWREVDARAAYLLDIMTPLPCSQFGYLYVSAQKDARLSGAGKSFIRFLANYLCSQSHAGKLLCQTARGTGYASYFAARQAQTIRPILNDCLANLDQGHEVRFKEISRRCFSSKKGSYFWAKALLEHLVSLGVAVHVDDWSVRRRTE